MKSNGLRAAGAGVASLPYLWMSWRIGRAGKNVRGVGHAGERSLTAKESWMPARYGPVIVSTIRMVEQAVVGGMQPFSRMAGGCAVEQPTLRAGGCCSLLLPHYRGI